MQDFPKPLQPSLFIHLVSWNQGDGRHDSQGVDCINHTFLAVFAKDPFAEVSQIERSTLSMSLRSGLSQSPLNVSCLIQIHPGTQPRASLRWPDTPCCKREQ